MSGTLRALYRDLGQSPWIDDLQRRHLEDGTIAELIKRGVRGLTTNPTIFTNAIAGSNDYDAHFQALIAAGHSPETAYWDLVLDDVRRAADLFHPVYDESAGVDGYVSIEVDPALARDSHGTVAAARELAQRASRANIMIKVPATREGVSAVRTLVGEGISVNVTLIFSVKRHGEVMEAYVSGLEDALSRGLPLGGIASVASFFMSRVDSAVDPLLETMGPEAITLRGRAAITQARLARKASQRVFSGPRWDRLAASGARIQRLLWASTSTKNPTYPDTHYVDELIGPDTVNTLPRATLEAFDDHGTLANTLDADPEGTTHDWSLLASLGVDLDGIAHDLEDQGVRAFEASFSELLTALHTKTGT